VKSSHDFREKYLAFLKTFLKGTNLSLKRTHPKLMKRYEGQNPLPPSLLSVHLLQGAHSHVGMLKLPPQSFSGTSKDTELGLIVYNWNLSS
jgi:hypothetical protein